MKIKTSHIYPPIPIREYDWCAIYDDYDGAEDSGNRGHIGYGRTEAEAIADLTENYPREDEHLTYGERQEREWRSLPIPELERLLKAERRRGVEGHWTYSLPRHSHMLAVYRERIKEQP